MENTGLPGNWKGLMPGGRSGDEIGLQGGIKSAFFPAPFDSQFATKPPSTDCKSNGTGQFTARPLNCRCSWILTPLSLMSVVLVTPIAVKGISSKLVDGTLRVHCPLIQSARAKVVHAL
ncbi:hypothetical protein OUZ56_031288 [Daphnia magna]|uniref:Uncharacterized protein n=1 Tax=Daphnia magna TaxID=35525 RepID=A0ABQ9ZTT6_9CRUS|nr:hypothetical protein OUZ56_031288 [Daphnia magna]